jgi:hypothetical protein
MPAISVSTWTMGHDMINKKKFTTFAMWVLGLMAGCYGGAVIAGGATHQEMPNRQVEVS